MGNNIQWDILRAPPVDTPPWNLHVSDCLQDLKPEDHIEIQRKPRRESTPYGRFLAILLSCCQILMYIYRIFRKAYQFFV